MDNLFLTEDVMFKALLEKDKTFEGQFIVGVKTTGIFCRPSCTARKPKKENVELLLNLFCVHKQYYDYKFDNKVMNEK